MVAPEERWKGQWEKKPVVLRFQWFVAAKYDKTMQEHKNHNLTFYKMTTEQ